MAEFIRTYFNKGYAVAKCLECDGMEVPFDSDEERAKWVRGHIEGHSMTAAFNIPMQHEAAIRDEERKMLVQLPSVPAAPTVSVAEILAALRIVQAPPPPRTTLVFHPRHHGAIHKWWESYEHREYITLVQNQSCDEDKLYTFPTPPIPGVV